MKPVLTGLFSLLLVLSAGAQVTNTLPAPTTNGAPLTAAPNAASRIAAPDPFSDPVAKEIEARHEKAVKGDKKETKALTADLEKWTKDQPKNFLLLAYLGSAYTLCSRDAWPGPGKLAFLKKGGQCLDAAVAGDPANPAVRFVRAINYFELPALFGKHRAANDDFHFLIRQLKGESPLPYALTAETAQAIYYYAGLSDLQFYQKPQAADAWRRGLQLDPNSPLGVKMQAELKKLK